MRGIPDDGNIVKAGDLYRLDDMAELAVRLGSIYSYHRYGDVVLMEDFERGLAKWSIYAFPTGSYAKLSTTRALSGNQSLECHVVAGTLSRVLVRKAVAPLVPGPIGLEVAMSYDGSVYGFGMAVVYYTGTKSYSAEVDYGFSTHHLRASTFGGGYRDFGDTGELYNGLKMFHIFKMIVDTELNRYFRVYLDNTAYDCSDLDLASTDSTERPRLEIYFLIIGPASGEGTVWLDDIVLTQNELTGGL